MEKYNAMRIHRFIGKFDFSKPLAEMRDPRIIRQLTRVLRLKPGATVILSDGNGKEYNAEIKKMDAHAIYFILRGERAETDTHEKTQIILCAAILKREHFEMVIEKATEIGVSEIVPLITDRTIKKSIQKDRAATIMREAAEQSGRNTLPILNDPVLFRTFIEGIPPESTVMFCDPEGKASPKNISDGDTSRYVFIGPEGGWTERERETAKKRGWVVASLGNMTLRAETAAIIATYLALRSQERYIRIQ